MRSADGGVGDARLAAAMVEIEALRAEVGRRRSLLGLDRDALSAFQIGPNQEAVSASRRSFEADSLGGLSILLVRARVAREWSQRQLAAELGIAEQQIQRYEANG